MSYEGYSQFVCAQGHAWDVDAMELMYGGDEHLQPKMCPFCGSPAVWENSVDQTNGYEEDNPASIPAKLEVDRPAVVEVCNLGHTHTLTRETYKIPADKGRKL